MIWVAIAIVIAALVVRHELRRLARVHTVFSTIVERMANRAAERNGEPPVTTKEDSDRFSRM